MTSENIVESVNEVEDVPTVGEAPECIVKIAVDVVEKYGVEDCRVETVDAFTGTEMVARFVESNIDDEVEDNVGTALVETAAPKFVARIVDDTVAIEDGIGTTLEEGTGTALEDRSSALMMSAAFARMLDSMLILFNINFRTFSATPYTTACKCAAGIIGNIPASTTLRFCVPTQNKELA